MTKLTRRTRVAYVVLAIASFGFLATFVVIGLRAENTRRDVEVIRRTIDPCANPESRECRRALRRFRALVRESNRKDAGQRRRATRRRTSARRGSDSAPSTGGSRPPRHGPRPGRPPRPPPPSPHPPTSSPAPSPAQPSAPAPAPAPTPSPAPLLPPVCVAGICLPALP